MKSFMKQVLAVIVGIMIMGMVMTVIGLVSMAGIMASEGASSSVADNSILRINLNGTLTERTEENPLNSLMGQGDEGISLDNVLQAIQKAAKNDKVKGIYLEGGALDGTPAMIQEIRQALVEFHQSGKWIIAYGDNYTQGSYYICSAADSVLLNPEGMIDWHGLASQPIFYTDVLKKVGVKMQVFKVGTFKSAVEPYINTEMSEPNREQVTSFLTSIWNNMVADVSKSRHISQDKLNALADSMVAFSPAKEVVKSKMADKLCYLDQTKSILKEKMGLDDDESLTFVSVNDMAASEVLDDVTDDKIAVFYAYGDIVDDAAGGIQGMNQGATIAPGPMNRTLQELADDEDIKAVVIRVNSGGGSAYASEQIWHQVELLKAKKPVVISMGGMAASGGYYISCGANKIVAEPNTLTGSIGIFGMIPDMSELLTQKVGLKFDVVKTNAMSDFGTRARPMNDDEGRMLQAHVSRGYELFTSRVAGGRHMKQDDVKKIAEGRVWTGEQALKIGLVDQLGNLQDAIAEAAKLAKAERYMVARYPAPESWLSTLMNSKNGADDYLESQLRNTLGEYYTTFSLLRTLRDQNPIQARITFDPNIR